MSYLKKEVLQGAGIVDYLSLRTVSFVSAYSKWKGNKQNLTRSYILENMLDKAGYSFIRLRTNKDKDGPLDGFAFYSDESGFVEQFEMDDKLIKKFKQSAVFTIMGREGGENLALIYGPADHKKTTAFILPHEQYIPNEFFTALYDKEVSFQSYMIYRHPRNKKELSQSFVDKMFSKNNGRE